MAPVILVTFAGREARMEILTRYVRAAMADGLIDEWHVWDFTRSDADHQWVTREFGPARYMGHAVGYQACGTASRRAPLRLEAQISNDLFELQQIAMAELALRREQDAAAERAGFESEGQGLGGRVLSL